MTYDTADAAAYLGLEVATIKYHLYKAKTLKPDGKHGAALYFNEKTLDEFKGRKRGKGRPKGSKNRVQYDD